MVCLDEEEERKRGIGDIENTSSSSKVTRMMWVRDMDCKESMMLVIPMFWRIEDSHRITPLLLLLLILRVSGFLDLLCSWF